LLIGFGQLKRNILIHVNGRDENCDEKFVWCGTNSTVGPEFPWGETEPNDVAGNENCINLITNGVGGILQDTMCYSKAYFICQASVLKFP
jgi:Lectin C-type domain